MMRFYALKTTLRAALAVSAIVLMPATGHAQIDARLDTMEKNIKTLQESVAKISGGEDTQKALQVIDERLRVLEQRIQDISIGFLNAQSGERLGAGNAPDARLNADRDDAAIWTRDDSLFDAPPKDSDAARITINPPDTATPTAPATSTQTAAAAIPDSPAATGQQTAPATGGNDNAAAVAVPVQPDADPEKVYKNTLSKLLLRDYDTAEEGFSGFIARNPGHELIADAQYWLGRTQFEGGKYDRAMKSFAKFQTDWPDDPRVEQTTLWIGESVVNVAPAAEACELLKSLPSLVPEPSDEFTADFARLTATAQCDS